MALSASVDRSVSGGTVRSLPLAAGVAPYFGSLLSYNSSGYAHPLTAGEPFAGVALASVRNDGFPNAGDGFVDAATGTFTIETTFSAARSALYTGAPIYASDDGTLTTTALGNTLIGCIAAKRPGSVTIRCFTRDFTALIPPAARRVATVADAATITVDASQVDVADITLTADAHAIDAPSNPVEGRRLGFRLRQGGSGSYTVTWNAIFKFTTSVAAPTLSTTVGKNDYLEFEYDATDAKWRAILVVLDN